jgi:hypothetical protein
VMNYSHVSSVFVRTTIISTSPTLNGKRLTDGDDDCTCVHCLGMCRCWSS